MALALGPRARGGAQAVPNDFGQQRLTGLLKEELNIESVNARRTLVQAVCREIEGLVAGPLAPRCLNARPSTCQQASRLS